MHPANTRVRGLLMGANGRVGRLLTTVWQLSPPKMHMLTQTRHGASDLNWLPAQQGPAPLLDFVAQEGQIHAITMLIGAGSNASRAILDDATKAVIATLHAAQIAGVSRVVIASSSAVYGLGTHMSETETPNPVSEYGRAKLDLETECLRQAPDDLELCLMRIGNVAGADALLSQVCWGRAPGQISLDQFADGEGPHRSYISPMSLARVIDALMTTPKPLPRILNVAQDPPIAMSALAQAAALNWSWTPAPAHRARTQQITLDCSALEDILGLDKITASPGAMVEDLRRLGALT